jgi:hypothetical protein
MIAVRRVKSMSPWRVLSAPDDCAGAAIDGAKCLNVEFKSDGFSRGIGVCLRMTKPNASV